VCGAVRIRDGQWFDWESAADDEGSNEESEEDTLKSAKKTHTSKEIVFLQHL